MATMVGMTDDFKNELKDLIELEYDAVAAYEASIERFESTTYKAKLSEFLKDHREHIAALTKLATSCGLQAPTEGDAKQLLTKGKVMIANLMGDKAILMAMKTNEDDTVTAYQRMLSHKNLMPEAKPAMERGLADETRHRSWIEDNAKDDARKAA